MADGVDEVENTLATEIAPASRPRDQQGKFIRGTRNPEPMFSSREIEGDPETGDTRDGGDDPRFRAREREIADGRDQRPRREALQEAREDSQHRRADGERRDNADADDGYELSEEEPENLTAISESDADESQQVGERDEPDEGARYEVSVDGETHHVSLEEALRGYVRQATFHQRVAQLTNVQQEIESEAGKLNANWKMWDKARRNFEEDVVAMMPREPNWDEEFARDPAAAHAQQKIYQALYGRLADSQRQRAEREAAEVEESNRRVQKYAIEGFSRFVAMSKIADEPTLKKELQSMRRTAMSAGFSEYEVATVYDPRMLVILRKASKYDRMTANRPKAVVSGQGRTLAPGAATPLGNVRRTGFDDANRRLASSGKISDAAEVFRRLL
jgi:hypothetical protein